MAYPSGSGSEILRRGVIHNQITADTAFKFDGTMPTTGTSSYTVPANHIITVLTISFANLPNSVKQFQLVGTIGGVNINFLYQQNVPALGTYVWNDRLVLHGGDKLFIGANSGSNFDVFYSYIDQNWE